MPPFITQFEQKLQENGINIREKFLKNSSGIYTGAVANSDNEVFQTQVLETQNGVVYQFQPIHEGAVQKRPVIAIQQLALDEALPLFARKIVEREMLVKEIAKKVLARNLAEKMVRKAIGQELANSLMNQAIQDTATQQEKEQQEKEFRKQEFFRKKTEKEQIINQKIHQIFDGKITVNRQLPTRNLPILSKILPEELHGENAAASRQENLKRKEESGLRDAEKRHSQQEQEEARSAQQQQEAERARQRKQQTAQRRQKSDENTGISWLTGGAIGAGVTIGAAGSFTLLFS